VRLYCLCVFLSAALCFGRCRTQFQSADHFRGRAGWERSPVGGYVGATEPRTLGTVVLTCTYRMPEPVKRVVFAFGGARWHYDGSGNGGLEIHALHDQKRICSLSGSRLSSEDWAEFGPAVYELLSEVPSRDWKIELTLADRAKSLAVRADVRNFEVRPPRPGESLRSCPAVR
jgi:hypothetical protein